MKDAVIILCGGGPAPGMNSVSMSVAKTFLAKGFRVIGLHGGYSGIHKDNRIIPATLRMSFFPKRTVNDGMFYFAEAGAGFHVPKTFKTRVSLVTRIGGGYRFALTKRCAIDLSATIMAAKSRPPIPNPDGPGYVAEQNIRSNSATYLAASLTIAVNL